MTTKKKTEQKVSVVDKKKEIDRNDKIARTFTLPTVKASMTLERWQSELDFGALHTELVKQVEAVNNGDMERPEAMLLCQAHTLDELFNQLAQRAFGQTHMGHYESFLRLAFKAQGQCRATLQTLSDIKNPSIVYAKQANINNGNQQINNGLPRTENNKIQHNELLEHTHGERLDSGTKGETISIDSDLAAMG